MISREIFHLTFPVIFVCELIVAAPVTAKKFVTATETIRECYEAATILEGNSLDESVMIFRPIVPVSRCVDMSTFCGVVFKIPEEDAVKNLNESLDYKVSTNCYEPQLYQTALEYCPSLCALCCKIPNFNCNDRYEKRKCQEILNAQLCNFQYMAEIALKNCPQTCGLCNNQGAAGSCLDISSDCFKWVGLLSCNTEFMKSNCQMTCELNSCLTMTSTNSPKVETTVTAV